MLCDCEMLKLLVFLILGSVASAYTGISELKGKTLMACVMDEPPYVTVESTERSRTRARSNYEGLAIDYLRLLEERLAFRVEVNLWRGTFSQLVEKFATCDPNRTCPCDFAIGAFASTYARKRKVDFIEPFGFESHRMIIRREDLKFLEHNGFYYVFEVFDIKVWTLIVLTVLVFAACASLVKIFERKETDITGNHLRRHVSRRRATSCPERCWNPRRRAKPDDTYPFDVVHVNTAFEYENDLVADTGHGNFRSGDSTSGSGRNTIWKEWKERAHGILVIALYVFQLFLGQTSPDKLPLKSFHRQAWPTLAYTAGVFLVMLYSAALTVNLFEIKLSSNFKTIKDVKSCRIPHNQVGFVKGTSSEYLWNHAIETANCTNKEIKPKLANDLESGVKLLRERKIDYFYALEGVALDVVTRNCKYLAAVGDPFFRTSVSFIVPKNTKFQGNLSAATQRLREEDRLLSAHRKAHGSTCEDQRVMPLVPLSRVGGFFVPFYLLLIVLVIHRWWHYRQRRRNRN